MSAKGSGSVVVLVVADFFQPVNDPAIEVLLNGNVGRGRGWRGAMLMVLARLEWQDLVLKI